MNILISAALNRELDPIRRTLDAAFGGVADTLNAIKIPVGMNARTSGLSDVLTEKHPDICINTGTAGALSDDLQPLDLFFPMELVDKRGEIIQCGKNRDPDSLKLPDWKSGRLYTSEEAVQSSSVKSALLTDYGARAVDMEAFKVARVCRAAGVPFLVLKVISDTADEQTKCNFNRNLDRAIEILCEHLVYLFRRLLMKGEAGFFG